MKHMVLKTFHFLSWVVRALKSEEGDRFGQLDVPSFYKCNKVWQTNTLRSIKYSKRNV